MPSAKTIIRRLRGSIRSSAFEHYTAVVLDQAQPFRTTFIVEGRPASDKHVQPQADFKFASPAYFQTLGIALLRGRLFTADDTAAARPVAILNLAMARRHFGDEDPIGRRVSVTGGKSWITVVGVVNDVREYALDANPADELYRPFAQGSFLSATLLVRAAGDTAPFARRLPDVVHEVDPRQPVSRIRTLETIKRHSLAPPRLTAMLVALFAVVALVITAAGIAGVVSFSVNQRTTEICVRMALGAPRTSVVRMIVGQGLKPVTIGLVLGLVGALLMTRVGAGLLFAVEPTDPPTYALVIATLASVPAIACLGPASRAAAIDPMRRAARGLKKSKIRNLEFGSRNSCPTKGRR